MDATVGVIGKCLEAAYNRIQHGRTITRSVALIPNRQEMLPIIEQVLGVS